MTSPLHSITWLVWAIAVAASLQIARNPLLVAIALAGVWLVVETHRRPGSLARAFPVLLGVAAAFGALRVVLIGLTTPTDPSAGGTLVTLPQATVPAVLGGFSVGGPVAQSVVLQTAVDSIVVLGIMAAFGAFNAVASHHELLGSAPRAFHEPGLVLTVALAFVPSTLDAARSAREADRARTGGRAVRRGWSVRLVVPVLETGLERAVHLAESMDARGFGRRRSSASDRAAAVAGGVGLVALAGSVVALVGRSGTGAAVLAALGTAGIVTAVVLSGRSAPERYRPRRLAPLDGAVMAVSLAVPVALGVLVAAGVDDLAWNAAALPLVAPSLPLLPAAAMVLLAVPALVRPR